MNKDTIKNVIFDLGNVIINIDFTLTTRAFAELAGVDYEDMAEKFVAFDVYDQYEKGLLSDAQFRDFMRENLKFEADDAAIDQAWNALLLDLPKERVDRLLQIGRSKRIFILSNTSHIHIKECNQILERSTGIADLKKLTEKTYLSYEIGMRKPHAEIYEYVLKDAGLIAEETLFIDDNADNIAGASEVGIQTIHLTNPNDFFKKLESI